MPKRHSNRPFPIIYLLFIGLCIFSLAALFYFRPFDAGDKLGHGLGIVGSTLMVLTLAYSLRRRLRFLSGAGTRQAWLNFHILCGILGPALVMYHTTFQMFGMVKITTYLMLIVVGSGFIGRYLYAHISHNVEGNGINVNEIREKREALFSEIISELEDDATILISQIEHISSRVKGAPARSSLIAFFWMLWADWLVWRTERELIRSINKLMRKDKAKRKRIRQLARQLLFYERQSTIEMVAERLLRLWHILHKPLTILLFIGMLLHIVMALYFT